jgi:probable rRNA maturation factor
MADAIATPLSEPEDPTKDPTKDPTYVKLAMRNMVRQGGKSIFHFALTTMGLLGLLVGLAFITR